MSLDFVPVNIATAVATIGPPDPPFKTTMRLHVGEASADLIITGASDMRVTKGLDAEWIQGDFDAADRVRLDTLATALEKGNTVSVETLQARLRALGEKAFVLSARLTITLVKDEAEPDPTVLIFSQVETFCRTLVADSQTWTEFERKWRPSLSQRMRVVVSDIDQPYTFTAFTLVGPEQPLPHSELGQEVVQRTQGILDRCRREVNWQGRPSRITPYCLQPIECDHKDILDSFLAVRERLALLYLPSNVFPHDAGLALYFSGSDKPFLLLPDNAPPLGTGAIGTLFDWAYDSPTSDRLAIVRRQIPANNPGEASILSELASTADAVLERSKTALEDTLALNVEAYYKKKKEADDAATKYVNETQKDVLSLVKDTSDSIYKTIGAVLATGLLTILKETYAPASKPATQYMSWLYGLLVGGVLVYIGLAMYHVWSISRVEGEKTSMAKARLTAAELQSRHHRLLEDEIDSASNALQGQIGWAFSVYLFILFGVAIAFGVAPGGWLRQAGIIPPQ